MQKQAKIGPMIEGVIERALTPSEPLFTKIVKRVGPVALLGAGLAGAAGIYSALDRVRSEVSWPDVRDAISGEMMLSPEEEGRAKDLFGMLQRYAPDLARDKMIAKSYIKQVLPMSEEGVWNYLSTLVRTQGELRDVKSRFEGPLRLAATASSAAGNLLGAV